MEMIFTMITNTFHTRTKNSASTLLGKPYYIWGNNSPGSQNKAQINDLKSELELMEDVHRTQS